MSCSYHTSNTINLVSATKYTAFGVMDYCVFVKDLVDCSSTAHGVIFAKNVAQITKQQGRYSAGHWLVSSRHRAVGNISTRNASLAERPAPQRLASGG